MKIIKHVVPKNKVDDKQKSGYDPLKAPVNRKSNQRNYPPARQNYDQGQMNQMPRNNMRQGGPPPHYNPMLKRNQQV